MKKILPLLVIVVLLWSCQGRSNSEKQVDSEPLKFSLSQLWTTDTIMKTPESVLFDPVRNVLYVANMNRTEEGTNTGFISKLGTDGTVIDLHWITGLNEPRGMGIYNDLLFATDMDRLLMIDIEKGEVQKTVPVEGSVFLNDLAVTDDGKVYFTDSRTGILHTYRNGKLSSWITDLEGPNGVFTEEDGGLILAVSGAGEVRQVNTNTADYDVLATGIAGDGIEYTGIDDYYIVSEWSGRIVVIGHDTVQTVLDTREQKINSADIGYHPRKQVVYVPTFFDNRVVAYALKME
ncbi:MAG: hypothetical protein K9G38_05810 [Bacteroidales bacterium]|nr:hypothetical protein [Bacteroidales bacterium]